MKNRKISRSEMRERLSHRWRDLFVILEDPGEASSSEYARSQSIENNGETSEQVASISQGPQDRATSQDKINQDGRILERLEQSIQQNLPITIVQCEYHSQTLRSGLPIKRIKDKDECAQAAEVRQGVWERLVRFFCSCGSDPRRSMRS